VGIHVQDSLVEVSKKWSEISAFSFQSLNISLDGLNSVLAEISAAKLELQKLKNTLSNIEQKVKITKENW
jgi:prefoldin subunit 5